MMSTSTTNLHLTKPAANEHADIAIINANYDLIDEFAGTVVVDPDYVHTENNYTTTEKQKLAGLENYTLPTASSSTKGGVKVDNESISIDQSGTISAALSGLNEVNIDAVTLSDGQILKYDATSGEWVNASGGSGHTILDDDGIALAQEDDLQIKGVYSADNSEDGVTEVNVYREMTKSEFDLLSDDEKKGFIRVTDEPDIYADGHFQPVIYSLEEREVGVWTDGRPLYEKTVDFGTLPNNTTKTVSYNISDLDYFVKIQCVAHNQNGSRNIPFVDDVYKSGDVLLDTIKSSGVIRIISHNDLSSLTGEVTLQYVKSTDVAGSGSWTPQGVPTHHYSTDEQVIGTWIDGKTLYEKTLVFDNPTKDSYNTFYQYDCAYDAGNIDFAKMVGINVYDSTDNRWYEIPYERLSNEENIQAMEMVVSHNYKCLVFFKNSQVYNLTKIVYTIQYTKSS